MGSGELGMYRDLSIVGIISLILLVVAAIVFFTWLFWTFSGMIMDYMGATKYGWVFQLVLTLILFAIVSGIGRIGMSD